MLRCFKRLLNYGIQWELTGLSDNARAWAKFERPKNACVFEGGRIWSSPHGRAKGLRARSAFCAEGGFRSGGVDIRRCLWCVKTLCAKSAGLARARSRGAAAGRRWRASTRMLCDGLPRAVVRKTHKCITYKGCLAAVEQNILRPPLWNTVSARGWDAEI